ncbi:copper resistance CopC family protein [Methylococcus sp. EFPC2]|uniref:copper resistance CopC family protein n=1 Tax=Methylococcus sp. EFPC2 TaxID=2812648 RepID=UPI001967569B|nr:copper resistance CopC family protein [Methylococcus sp. EFPC2]QSA97105.1 copper resistance protein CopC [Methylococcus sp. EFPC2]
MIDKLLPATLRRLFLPLIACGLLLAPTAEVAAHAVVTESSLKHKPIEVNHETEVVLHFNSNVELGLSKVFLVSKGDIYHPLEIASGKKPGQVIIKVPALSEGDYAIKYKVFAADGHITEDVLRFKVSAQR